MSAVRSPMIPLRFRTSFQSNIRPRRRFWLVLVLAGGISGCSTLSGDENEVVIEYSSPYPGAAQLMADRHCAKFGKAVLHVQRGIEETGFMGFRTKTSIFECVARADDPAGGGAEGKDR